MAEKSQKTILVADDNANIRHILRYFLESAGFRIIEAANGREAVTLAGNHLPDLVILDVMMPLTDGFTACAMIKGLSRTRDIPVVMCTGRGQKEDVLAGIRAGASDYIVKPFDRDIVLAKVERTLDTRAPRLIPTPGNVDRRTSARRSVAWTVSWGKAAAPDRQPPLYRERLVDLSVGGFGFQAPRCSICTGSSRGGVHPLCVLYDHSRC
ncbi:MAG: response regulator transcription factor, partial [Planctomycetota bacterium]